MLKLKFKSRVSLFCLTYQFNENLVDEKTNNADIETWEKFNITVEELAELLATFENEPEVKEMQSIIEDNNQRIFKGIRPDFKLEYPDKITTELYFEVLTTIFEVIRYEAYWRLRYRIRENGGSKLTYFYIF